MNCVDQYFLTTPIWKHTCVDIRYRLHIFEKCVDLYFFLVAIWADRQTLLNLYRSLIHSQLEYTIFIYRSSQMSYLKQFDPIHHEGLRQVFGAFRTSPVDSLYAKAHEAPLRLGWEKLALQYYTKLKSCPCSQAYDCIINPKCQQYFEKKRKNQ